MVVSGKAQGAIIIAGAVALWGIIALFGFPSGKALFQEEGNAQSRYEQVKSITQKKLASSQQIISEPEKITEKVSIQASFPRFEMVRINPRGEAAVTGQASPRSVVELLVDSQVYGRIQLTDLSTFTLTSHPFPPGDHNLTLRATLNGEVFNGPQSIMIIMPEDKTSSPVVILSEASKPTVVLAGPGIDEADSVNEGRRRMVQGGEHEEFSPAAISVVAVEAEGGKLYVSGSAPAGSKIRLYLNDSYLAEETASPLGRVAFRMDAELDEGGYRIRLDQISLEDGKVLSRAEVPFEMDRSLLAPSFHEHAHEMSPEDVLEKEAATTVSKVATTQVMRGDSLWRISQRIYGEGTRYTIIYGANRDHIRDPDLIYPGQIFVLPKVPL